MSFTPRLTAPGTSDTHYYADNPFYQSGYGMPNCTCYAWGRFYEILESRPTLSLGDAENWYGYSDGYDRGSTPKLGAVICWRRGAVGDDSDGAGHVAVVEQINADGSIVTSNSAWNSTNFYLQTLTPESDYTWNSNYTFQGFIYNPAVSEELSDEEYIWNYFSNKIGNDYGVAGLMGNLYAESALKSNNLQNSYETSLGYTDESYTAAVDSGAYSESSFVNDEAGYGLAQWTYYSRKQGLYDMWQSGSYDSIGCVELACDYLWYELQNSYAGVLSVLRSATSVRTASDAVLHDFERPADQSTAVEELREEYSMIYYNKYAGTTPDDPDDPEPHPARERKSMNLLLMLLASKRS